MNPVNNMTTGIIAAMMISTAVLIAGPGEAAGARQAVRKPKKEAVTTERTYQVPPPPFTPGIFPCSNCHADMKPNYAQRVLKDEHVNIKLNHGKKWCFTCHNPNNRDVLRLADGTLLSFEKSYLLCGQCHGPNLRDWKTGIHGKMTGMWNGKKQYLLCAHCHNPHAPRFRPLKPSPPPLPPDRLRRDR